MLLEDFKFWKVRRFIKDPIDASNCEKILRKNIVELKDIYTTLISLSNYPNVNWLEFSGFVR